MALCTLPQLAAAALPLPYAATTRIPHLLRAIAANRAAKPAAPRRRNASTNIPSSLPPTPTTTRRLPPHKPPPHPPRRPRPITAFLPALSLFAFTLACYTTYTYSTYRAAAAAYNHHDDSTPPKLEPNADVTSRWNDATRDFDAEIELSERLMALGRKRRRLVQRARGTVLEVSSGTGRNLEFYDWGRVDGVVFNDQSAVQLGVLRGKWEEEEKKRRRGGEVAAFEGPVEFVVGDAGVRGVVGRPEGGFDVVVQTMGICSQRDPVGFLRRMGELCRQPDLERQLAFQEWKKGEKKRLKEKGEKKIKGMEKEESEVDDGLGGRILLLEHGRGYYNWLNRVLDAGAPMHADHYGCWWNRDIGAIVEESGLKVESIRRYHLGTTWEVVLRPNPNPKA